MITILGLGPGDPNLLTREAWGVISRAKLVYVRTRRHPTVAGFPKRTVVRSFDHLYRKHAAFDDVYAAIVTAIMRVARKGNVVYAVPGHPLFGEKTTSLLLAQARLEGVSTRVIGGLSYVEPTLEALTVASLATPDMPVIADPMNGLQLCDALDLAVAHHPALDPDRPVIIGQIYSRAVASNVKLTLMNQYGPRHMVCVVGGERRGTTGVGSSDAVRWLPLAELDHGDWFDHLTSLYVTASSAISSFARLQETTAHLRAPEGCPWDQEQTHASLRNTLLEEAYETLQTIDQDDMPALKEELGDLLFNIVLQVQIATEAEEFRMIDVIESIDAKLKRRHPHVFGDVHVADAAQVLINWETIKKSERKNKGETRKGALDGIARALPALAKAQKMGARVERSGFRWDTPEQRLAKVREELQETLAARDEQQRFEELGDLLFTLAVVANGYHVDAESALRAACAKFAKRFSVVERLVDDRGQEMKTMTSSALLELWAQAKQRART